MSLTLKDLEDLRDGYKEPTPTTNKEIALRLRGLGLDPTNYMSMTPRARIDYVISHDPDMNELSKMSLVDRVKFIVGQMTFHEIEARRLNDELSALLEKPAVKRKREQTPYTHPGVPFVSDEARPEAKKTKTKIKLPKVKRERKKKPKVAKVSKETLEVAKNNVMGALEDKTPHPVSHLASMSRHSPAVTRQALSSLLKEGRVKTETVSRARGPSFTGYVKTEG